MGHRQRMGTGRNTPDCAINAKASFPEKQNSDAPPRSAIDDPLLEGAERRAAITQGVESQRPRNLGADLVCVFEFCV